MLERFFAVTRSRSLYCAETKVREEQIIAHAVKVAGKGTGCEIGAELINGALLGIDISRSAFRGLAMFYRHPKYGREYWKMNTSQWGGNTMPLVGLFLDEAEARGCLAATRLKTRDSRWEEQTQAVIAAIGTDHPAFVVAPFEALKPA